MCVCVCVCVVHFSQKIKIDITFTFEENFGGMSSVVFCEKNKKGLLKMLSAFIDSKQINPNPAEPRYTLPLQTV